MRGDEGSQKVTKVEKRIRGEFSVKPTGLMTDRMWKGRAGRNGCWASIRLHPRLREIVKRTEGPEKASRKRQPHRLALELDVNRWSETIGVKARRWARAGTPPGLNRGGKGKNSYMGT